MAKVIAVSNEKGGVGKTTTTYNLGYALAQRGKKVLLADLDGQANLTSMACRGGTPKKTICELLTDYMSDGTDINRADYVFSSGNVDVLPSKDKLSEIATAMVNVTSREYVLSEALEIFGDSYDYIIIDCKGSVDVLTVNALAAAGSVIIPSNADTLSLDGVESLVKHIGKLRKRINPGLTIEGILVTMLDARTRTAREHLEALAAAAGERLYVFHTRIPYSVKMKEAAAERMAVFELDGACKPARAYDELAAELLKNMEGRKNG